MNSARSDPVTQPHRIMTDIPRSRTEPGARGFLKSMMRQQDIDGFDEGLMMFGEPEKQPTQEDQDAEDAKARKRAMRNLVNSWQERLQLISVITTFFASTEAAMLVNAKPANTGDLEDPILKATNACLLGALIVHVYAAVLSFLGAFLLIRYKLKEATRDEMLAEGMKLVSSPSVGTMIKDLERGTSDAGMQRTLTNADVLHKSGEYDTAKIAPDPRKKSFSLEPPIISTHPHLEQVGPFMSSVSSHLLSRTHALCVCSAAIGFVLAIAGILCYAWATQHKAVSIFASTCLGGAVLATGVLLSGM